MKSLCDTIFLENLQRTIGREDALRVVEAMGKEPSVSVRLNPFKKPDSPLPILEGSSPVPWSPCGRILKERPVFTLHPLFHAGAYYVQDSSAMYVGCLFREALAAVGSDRPLRVLDLCAAPGGKTTDLASSLRQACGDDFLLVSNEVMRQRASVLCANVTVWGDPNVAVTSLDPKVFASLPAFFDIILADVPCSGEGMFRKDAKAVEDWSPENVSLCASRQKRILADVWPSLRPGGILVYSTCTFEDAENDANLEWAASELGGSIQTPSDSFGVRTTRHGHLLLPGEVPGEGQWCGMLVKDGVPSCHGLSVQASMDRIRRFRPLKMGANRGEMKGRDFVPDPDWALSLSYDRGTYPEAAVDKPTALRYLHRDSLVLPDAPRGYLLLTYRGLPLGFVKNLGSRCNNLHPQSRRIRMDVSL